MLMCNIFRYLVKKSSNVLDSLRHPLHGHFINLPYPFPHSILQFNHENLLYNLASPDNPFHADKVPCHLQSQIGYFQG